MIIPFWAKAIVLALLIGCLSWFWYDNGYDKRNLEVKTEQLATIEELTKQKQAREVELRETSQKLQDALRDVRVKVVYVDRITRHEIEKPIYNQCVVPESGVILINQNAERLNNLREPQK